MLLAARGSSMLGDVAQQRVGKIASKHRADLRDLARRPEPVEPRGERLLQGRRDRLHAALLAALEQQARHLLDEQRHAAGALADPSITSCGSAWRAAISATMRATCGAIERRERDRRCGASACSKAGGTPAASSPR